MPYGQKRKLDPTLTRKGFLRHPGSLAMAAGGLLFVLYVFNVNGTATFLDNLFSSANSSAQSHNDEVVNFTLSAVPYAVGGIALLFVFFIAVWLKKKLRLFKRRRFFRNRQSLDVQGFVLIAKQQGISTKVAMQTYRILKPSYEGNMRAKLDDDLRANLHKSDTDIDIFRQRLLHFCDRKHPIGGPEITDTHTVLDLMQYVEKAPSHFITHSMARRLRGEKSDPLRKAALSENLSETRLLVPLHKRVEKLEKAAAAPVAQSASEAAKPATETPSTSSSEPGDFIQPLHKRF